MYCFITPLVMAEHHMHPNFALYEHHTVLVADAHRAHLVTILHNGVEEGDHFDVDTSSFKQHEGFFAKSGIRGGAPEMNVDDAHTKQFSKVLAEALFKKHQENAVHKLIICAPAKMLNYIEDALHTYLKDVLVKKVVGDFTKMTNHDMIEHL